MKNLLNRLLLPLLLLMSLMIFPEAAAAQNSDTSRQVYQIKIYHFDNANQENQVDEYLKNAYLPALHRRGIEPVGVFKPVGQDTTADRRTYVLIPFESLNQLPSVQAGLAEDPKFQDNGAAYIQALHDQPPYAYIESVILEAFSHAPRIQTPDLASPRSQRIYELRSYGSATEALNKNKVEMFNEGGEIELFERLGFNAVFYGNVLAGSEMPNLMYMTSFESMASRDSHWEQFVDDPQWEKLSSMKKYQNNVSRMDIQLLRATGYSDL